MGGGFRKLGYLILGVLIIRILLYYIFRDTISGSPYESVRRAWTKRYHLLLPLDEFVLPHDRNVPCSSVRTALGLSHILFIVMSNLQAASIMKLHTNIHQLSKLFTCIF